MLRSTRLAGRTQFHRLAPTHPPTAWRDTKGIKEGRKEGIPERRQSTRGCKGDTRFGVWCWCRCRIRWINTKFDFRLVRFKKIQRAPKTSRHFRLYYMYIVPKLVLINRLWAFHSELIDFKFDLTRSIGHFRPSSLQYKFIIYCPVHSAV